MYSRAIIYVGRRYAKKSYLCLNFSQLTHINDVKRPFKWAPLIKILISN